VREATEGGNALLSQINNSGGVVVDLAISALNSSSDAIDLLVDLSTVVIAHLTGAGDGELDAGRMPGANTSNLSQTAVSLAGQASNTPTSDDALITSTLVDTDDIDHLVLSEYSVDRHLLLEQTASKVNLVADRATVDLDLQQVSLLLSEADEADLGVSEDSDDLSVLSDALDLSLHILVRLISNAGSITIESLLLGSVPVLVESSLDFLAEVLGPHGGQGAKTAGSLDITDHTDHHHGGSLNNGHSLNSLALVELRTGLVDLTKNVCHTGLITKEGSEMRLLRGIIAGK